MLDCQYAVQLVSNSLSPSLIEPWYIGIIRIQIFYVASISEPVSQYYRHLIKHLLKYLTNIYLSTYCIIFMTWIELGLGYMIMSD